MTMSNHTTSLEISKQLKEAGWKKETMWYWTNAYYVDHMGWIPTTLTWEKDGKAVIHPEKERWILNLGSPIEEDRYGKPDERCIQYSAPLATEILEELPKKDDTDNLAKWHFEIELTKGGMFYCRYVHSSGKTIPETSDENEDNWISICDKSLADSLAKMWLYLKQEGLIK